MKLLRTKLEGCLRVVPAVREDARGRLVKLFHAPTFEEHGIRFDAAESYYSTSARGVIRGLHLQSGPAAHAKLVYCVAGEALDALVDLRQGSATYGEFELFELTPQRPEALYVPPGVAHGFLARTDDTTLVYATSAPYAPEHDGGVRWDSVGIPWGIDAPIVSDRDSALPPFLPPSRA